MTVLDRIYEAAFVPELWAGVLEDIARASGANSGAMLIIDQKLPPLFAATPNVVDTLTEFAETPFWYENPPAHRLRKLQYSGFLERANFFYDHERNGDNPYHHNMEKIGADWQVGSVVDMADGEMALFTFERQSGLPDFGPQELALLDGLRPHLARAALMASRLKLERAEASVATLNALQIPACVIGDSGVVISANALFERLGDVLRPAAFGRLAARDRVIDRMLQAALAAPERPTAPEIRSFPIRLAENDRAVVIHVIPLHRTSRDIFDRSAAVVAVTGYAVDSNLPSDTVLRGLFDLSAAEAGIAGDLSAGHTVKEIAARRGISVATARTHLAQIFRKTGTGQQGQLIALLKGISGYSGWT